MLVDALAQWERLIHYQYSGSKDAMSFLQECDDIGQKALTATEQSSTAWLNEKKAEALEYAACQMEEEDEHLKEHPDMEHSFAKRIRRMASKLRSQPIKGE